jgi:hypothetical protein
MSQLLLPTIVNLGNELGTTATVGHHQTSHCFASINIPFKNHSNVCVLSYPSITDGRADGREIYLVELAAY